ncbi:MAG TPA: response regulator [Polyangia bacterium]|nr:response regulator [Polyangia bacterium]
MSAPAWILVVDDDHAIRETLRAILKDEGYEVVAARDGRQALDQLETMAPPGLCIVDLVMPVMNGWELCAELALRPSLARVPVLLVSANSHLDAPPPGLETVHVMKKPISFDRLLEYVERYCKR